MTDLLVSAQLTRANIHRMVAISPSAVGSPEDAVEAEAHRGADDRLDGLELHLRHVGADVREEHAAERQHDRGHQTDAYEFRDKRPVDHHETAPPGLLLPNFALS